MRYLKRKNKISCDYEVVRTKNGVVTIDSISKGRAKKHVIDNLFDNNGLMRKLIIKNCDNCEINSIVSKTLEVLELATNILDVSFINISECPNLKTLIINCNVGLGKSWTNNNI